MTKILGIHGGRKPGQPSEIIIETLTLLLERAKAGELIGLGYATVTLNGELGTGWEGEPADGLRYRLASAIHILDYRYTNAIITDK